MQTYDIKKERKDLYAPKQVDFELVDVPEMGFLMIDGHGDPNTSTAYREAVEALYTACYAVPFRLRTAPAASGAAASAARPPGWAAPP